MRDIGSISISFEFKKIFDRFLYEIDTSLIKKRRSQKDNRNFPRKRS
ncbi:MAG: hypothetical protein MR902_03455 [Campylobacter sp.]|nr:hypothetical protein [Campylobacter sp.]